MRVTFKYGPHFVALEDGKDPVCQDQMIRDHVTSLMDMSTMKMEGDPSRSPVFDVMQSLEGYVTDIQWIETDTIY